MTDSTPLTPFDRATDPDRHHIWQRLIIADSEAFLRTDWQSIADDFDADHFEGIRCHDSPNPADWTLAFPTLESYRDSWLESSRKFLSRPFADVTHRDAIYTRTHLTTIDLAADRALAHKQFFGDLPMADGSTLTTRRQTLYRLHRKSSAWKIVGFLGQLPLPAPHLPQAPIA